MTDLDRLIATVPTTSRADDLLAEFVPPARFAEKRFDNYTPDPRHPTQQAARERLRALAEALHRRSSDPLRWVRSALGRARTGRGIYLDGGFGVGKTHLLAALWNAAPSPKVYLSFDELVYTLGLLGVERARRVFQGQRLVAVDEWELDDPGNLKLALAWLRGALADGVQVAVTSNTVPDELGRGRFSQKSFAAEIEELSAAFETLRIEGEDYRHRHFEADPGREYFQTAASLSRRARAAGERALWVPFADLLEGLGRVHPIRYAALVELLDGLLVEDVAPVAHLPDALRWVHFVDKLYDAAIPLLASSEVPLGGIFSASFITGSYGKKFSRCLSRMEELLGEADASPEVLPGYVTQL